MAVFKSISLAMLVGLIIYTGFVVSNAGWNFLPYAVDNLRAVSWSGQFALDFVCYLVVSALWVAWRHRFSSSGIGLGLAALVGGYLFFGVYLLIASIQARGNVAALLLGERHV